MPPSTSISYRRPELQSDISQHYINNTKIFNIYIPPSSSCTSGYKPSLLPLLQHSDTLILEDFNAHDPLWYSQLSDTKGSVLADEISNSNFRVLNEDSPTRLPTNRQPTSPDFSLASLSLPPYSSWKTRTNLSSDHLPIIINIVTDIKPITSDNRTFINFRKADWQKFQSGTEAEFSNLPHLQMSTKVKIPSEKSLIKFQKPPFLPGASKLYSLRSQRKLLTRSKKGTI